MVPVIGITYVSIISTGNYFDHYRVKDETFFIKKPIAQDESIIRLSQDTLRLG
jgi:hypothetical protein